MLEENKNRIHTTTEFDQWLHKLVDAKGKTLIIHRLDCAEIGYFGDCKGVGGGMSEMRVFVGPGYRIYFVRTGRTDYLMLTGSDKTDQARAIKRAKRILDALRRKMT
ncbi:type II toxin-antitoxin system RelE/ParE family toxin [Pseudomonas sp. MYb118]|uniref:type II toxin-antitoxin system RelE/ParE family toxin n=1 Tax=Pseudomonas sp. MYb118 TaxID=1848720 RepID=UPI0034CF7733